MKGKNIMKKIMILLLLVLVSISFAAQRVVLFEDFTNSGCGPCWSAEPQINAFIAANIASGNLCIVRPHVDWPSGTDPIFLANPIEQNARKAQYGVSSVPYLKMDGIVSVSAATLQTSYDQRLAEPAIIDIDVARNGDDESGTFSYRIIAEEDPEWTFPMHIWSLIVEDNIPGAGYWAGSVFEQALRMDVFSPVGQAITFEGPFPDTIYVDAEYEIDASWDADEIHLATFIQCVLHISEHEVENAHWAKFLDLETGISEESWDNSNRVLLSVGPNPSNGTFAISAVLPENAIGNIEVFDLTGRTVATGTVAEMQNISVDESGLYLVRLSTPEGLTATQSIAVIK